MYFKEGDLVYATGGQGAASELIGFISKLFLSDDTDYVDIQVIHMIKEGTSASLHVVGQTGGKYRNQVDDEHLIKIPPRYKTLQEQLRFASLSRL